LYRLLFDVLLREGVSEVMALLETFRVALESGDTVGQALDRLGMARRVLPA
jgi:hypothetical protein